MRLVRLVVAGVALGAVGGYVAALLRPRTVHRNPAADLAEDLAGDLAELGSAPLPERRNGETSPELTTVPETVEARR
jgi:hypothetical protein